MIGREIDRDIEKDLSHLISFNQDSSSSSPSIEPRNCKALLLLLVLLLYKLFQIREGVQNNVNKQSLRGIPEPARGMKCGGRREIVER